MSGLWWFLLITVDYGLAGYCITTILRRRKEPSAMMAWILIIVLVPFLGMLLYVTIGDPRITRQIRKRQRKHHDIATKLSGKAAQSAPGGTPPMADPVVDERLAEVVRIAAAVGGQTCTGGNEVTIYYEAERTYLALRLEIEAARTHVHMQYYIMQPDDTGRLFRDLLIKKAREGVRCRLLLDGVGSFSLTDEFIRPMEEAGVEVEFFLPVRLQTRRIHLNLRNHRKIVVIDGKVAFTGSQNIGEEYLGRKQRFGPWRDTHLRVSGPAAVRLQEVFVEDWYFASGRDLSANDAHFPTLPDAPTGMVQIVPTGPDRTIHPLHMLLVAAMTAARRSICITTPYFVPDAAVLMAMRAAAVRGVCVQLLIPSKSDNPLVLWAGRSYYGELVQSGVEIYEFDKAMLHSKVLVVDQQWSMVGSANMDVRSFRLNFELTAMLYDSGLAQSLYADFAELRDRAKRIPPNPDRTWSFPQSLLVGVARLASPLL